MLIVPQRRLIVPASDRIRTIDRAAATTLRGRYSVARPSRFSRWARRPFTRLMADGDQLLDDDGNWILRDNGDRHQDDAAGNDCCCGTPVCCTCDNCYWRDDVGPSIATITIAGFRHTSICFGTEKILSGDLNGTWTLTGGPCGWDVTFPDAVSLRIYNPHPFDHENDCTDYIGTYTSFRFILGWSGAEWTLIAYMLSADASLTPQALATWSYFDPTWPDDDTSPRACYRPFTAYLAPGGVDPGQTAAERWWVYYTDPRPTLTVSFAA